MSSEVIVLLARVKLTVVYQCFTWRLGRFCFALFPFGPAVLIVDGLEPPCRFSNILLVYDTVHGNWRTYVTWIENWILNNNPELKTRWNMRLIKQKTNLRFGANSSSPDHTLKKGILQPGLSTDCRSNWTNTNSSCPFSKTHAAMVLQHLYNRAK